MRKLILRITKEVIFRFSEKTGPEVKYSHRNEIVAKALMAIGEIEDDIK